MKIQLLKNHLAFKKDEILTLSEARGRYFLKMKIGVEVDGDTKAEKPKTKAPSKTKAEKPKK